MSVYYQHLINLLPRRRGCHLVTKELITRDIQHDISTINVGLCNLFIQHTSAGLTINENADSDVPVDMENFFRNLVPDNTKFNHDAEGPDGRLLYYYTILILF